MAAPSTERWTVRARALLLVAFASIALARPAAAEEGIEWPREIDTKRGKVTIYQPQLDTFEGNSFTGRAAVSVTPKDKEPVFGVAWFKATCETDRREREVHLPEAEAPEGG
jgi:hypothetical protein